LFCFVKTDDAISHSKPIQLLSSLSIILKIYMYRWLIVLLILVRIVVDLHCFTPYFIWITTLHCNLDNKGYTSIGIWQHKNIHHPITYHIIRWGKTNEPIKPNHKPTLDPINCFFSRHTVTLSNNIYIEYKC
jgi:hypothetical protein